MSETAKIIEFENVSEKASTLNQEAQDMLTTYKQTQIKTNDQYVKAGDVLKEIKTKIKDLDEERKAATRPLDDTKKKIMDWFKRPLGWLQEAESAIKRSMLSFQQEQKRLRDEQQRKIDEEAKRKEEAEKKKLKDRADNWEGKGNDTKAESLREQAEEVQHVAPVLASRVEHVPGISTKKVWKFEITDANQIPREWLVPDEKSIGAFVRSTKGVKKIAGVKIFAEETIAAGRA